MTHFFPRECRHWLTGKPVAGTPMRPTMTITKPYERGEPLPELGLAFDITFRDQVFRISEVTSWSYDADGEPTLTVGGYR